MRNFTKELLHVDDVVVYLKNERTGSSTVRKCKFIGQIVDFTMTKVKILRFSQPDTFVTPDEIQDLGIDAVCPDDVVSILCSKYQEDMHAETLIRLNSIINKKNQDIELLLGNWFCAVEDSGIDPWKKEECVKIANKYNYTEDNYKQYLSTIV